jgi:protein-L-isoaspartate(D-aspartate) O-methyltransferase
MRLALPALIAACLGSLAIAGAWSPPRPLASIAPQGAAARPASDNNRLTARRHAMVESQLRARGIRNAAVLAAMEKVPRHLFVPEPNLDLAYEDGPLPIGYGQTISQPYIVAYMSEALEVSRTDKVLEIGTGSGYQAAILAELAREVYTIEIVPELAERARALLAGLGYRNVHVRVGDGYLGWPELQPFDRIIVTAAPDHVPEPLVSQLVLHGRMVLPVGPQHQGQRLVILTRTPKGPIELETLDVVFVPLVRKGPQ